MKEVIVRVTCRRKKKSRRIQQITKPVELQASQVP